MVAFTVFYGLGYRNLGKLGVDAISRGYENTHPLSICLPR